MGCACIPVIASGLGGGMGLQGMTCGAITGGVLLIGLKFGSDRADDDDAKNKVYSKTAEYVRRFQEINGAVSCREITGLDISNPQGLKAFHTLNIKENNCIPAVNTAVGLLLEIIDSK